MKYAELQNEYKTQQKENRGPHLYSAKLKYSVVQTFDNTVSLSAMMLLKSCCICIVTWLMEIVGQHLAVK